MGISCKSGRFRDEYTESKRLKRAPSSRGAMSGHKRYTKRDLRFTDSDHLCPFCYDPAYVPLNSPDAGSPARGGQLRPRHGVCINPSCKYPRRMLDPGGVREECFADFDDAVKGCDGFDRRLIFQTLYGCRAAALRRFPLEANMRELLALDYMMVCISKRRRYGDDANAAKLKKAFSKCKKRHEVLDFFGEMDDRTVVADGAEYYVAKYRYVIVDEILKENGLVDPQKYGLKDVHEFDFIDKQAITGADLGDWDWILRKVPSIV